MKEYYELHITIEEPPDQTDRVRNLIENFQTFTWKFSKIEGDVILGSGVKMYATTQLNVDEGEMMCTGTLDLLHSFLVFNNVNVVRKKIERVVKDWIKGRDF